MLFYQTKIKEKPMINMDSQDLIPIMEEEGKTSISIWEASQTSLISALDIKASLSEMLITFSSIFSKIPALVMMISLDLEEKKTKIKKKAMGCLEMMISLAEDLAVDLAVDLEADLGIIWEEAVASLARAHLVWDLQKACQNQHK